MTSKRPASSTNFLINLFSTLLFTGLAVCLFDVNNFTMDATNVTCLLVLSVLPIIAYEMLKNDMRKKFRRQNEFSISRILTKLFALFTTYLAIAFIYWLFPFYARSQFSDIIQNYNAAIPYIFLISIPYVVVVDLYMPKPKDSLWHAGNIIIRQEKPDWRMLGAYAKAWLVKLFFGTLMLAYFISNLESLQRADIMSVLNLFSEPGGFTSRIIYGYLFNLIYLIDLLFALVGYMLTLKLFDTQIRSTEPTLFGWAVCLACYEPFWSTLSSSYMHYDDGTNWMSWIGDNTALYCVWWLMIIGSISIYSLATVAFGIRFSNLTYRGVITNGPYRFTKHPAYVFKNLSWWLISIPFISDAGWEVAVRNCLALFLLNIIYYLRARTEENHLSNYPEYVKYAEYMNERSIFRWLAKPLPFLKYSAKRAANSGSRIYKPFAA